jgi:uncharacterized protein (DUF2249 family)
MKRPTPLKLDVRPLLASKRPPLPAIMDAVSRLEDGQSLQLIAPFDPAPLRDMLAARGFDNTTRETAPGVWVVEFTPRADQAGPSLT